MGLISTAEASSLKRRDNILGHNDHITPEHRYWRSTDESLPKDGQVVLLATGGGAFWKDDAAIWIATFVAEGWYQLDSKHPKHFYTWNFITLENQNDLYPGLLGDYKWMPLPSNPFRLDANLPRHYRVSR
jgi:hypothetical protein